MSRSEANRLRDARDYADSAQTLARGHSAVALSANKDRLDAILFRIVIVGETIGHVPDATTSLEPNIPWRTIVDTRNRIVHAYWQIDLEIVVAIVERELQPLIDALGRLIAVVSPQVEP